METLNQDHYDEWRGGLPAREQFPRIQIKDSGGLSISHLSSSDPHLLVVVLDTFWTHLEQKIQANSGDRFAPAPVSFLPCSLATDQHLLAQSYRRMEDDS